MNAFSLPLHAGRVFGFVVAIVAVVVPLAAGLSMRADPPNDGFWERLRIGGLETTNFGSLPDLLDASDAVVLAKVSKVEVGRTIQGDSADDLLTYAQITLSVVRVVAGDAPAVVPLEFVAGARPEQVAQDVIALRAAMPHDTALYFLHEKRGQGEAGLYRVTNSAGLWTSTSRAALDTPLREEAPADGRFADDIVGVGSVSELADLVSSYATAP